MTRPYRPSNATAGDVFEARFCRQCWRMKEDGREPCKILGAMLFHDVNEPEYPKELVMDDSGANARCTAFEDINQPEPRPRCDKTPDMFT